MKVFPITNAPRSIDGFGSGAFAASRGSRIHKGKDYEFKVGEVFKSPVGGTVIRIGWAYTGWGYRIVELLSFDKTVLFRFFYVAPVVKKGDRVEAEQILGHAQDIKAKYGNGMTNHIHVECIVDPDAFFIDQLTKGEPE